MIKVTGLTPFASADTPYVSIAHLQQELREAVNAANTPPAVIADIQRQINDRLAYAEQWIADDVARREAIWEKWIAYADPLILDGQITGYMCPDCGARVPDECLDFDKD